MVTLLNPGVPLSTIRQVNSFFPSFSPVTNCTVEPIEMSDGSKRKFIEDGDTVTMKGHAVKDGIRVGFGEVSAKVLPAAD